MRRERREVIDKQSNLIIHVHVIKRKRTAKQWEVWEHHPLLT